MKHLRCCLTPTISLLIILTSQLSAQWIQSGPYNNFILAFENKGTNLFTGSFGGGVYISSDNGINWIAVIAGLTNAYVSNLTASSSKLFAGTDDGVFVTTNNGTLWNHKGLVGKYVQTLAMDGTYLYAGTFGDGAFRSSNEGTSWTAINNGLSNDKVICLILKDTIIFAGTSGGGVFRSTNKGDNWINVNSGLTNTDVRSLAIIDTILFAGTYGGGIFLSLNNGTNWSEKNTGLSNKFVLPLTTSGTNLFAGTSGGGVFLTSDYGSNWSEVNNGLTSLGISALKVMGQKIFAGTAYAGVWRRPLSEIITSVENNSFAEPNTFNLYQNHPNPFNSTTRISFSIPEDSFVSLKIFDALGREITTLISDKLTTGEYGKDWDAAELTSGTYFYQLVAGNYKETRKMILLR